MATDTGSEIQHLFQDDIDPWHNAIQYPVLFILGGAIKEGKSQ